MKLTLSVIKADLGGYVVHASMHPDLIAKADDLLRHAKRNGMLIDYHVTRAREAFELIITLILRKTAKKNVAVRQRPVFAGRNSSASGKLRRPMPPRPYLVISSAGAVLVVIGLLSPFRGEVLWAAGLIVCIEPILIWLLTDSWVNNGRR